MVCGTERRGESSDYEYRVCVFMGTRIDGNRTRTEGGNLKGIYARRPPGRTRHADARARRAPGASLHSHPFPERIIRKRGSASASPSFFG
jgi:hypothetical protein